MHKRQLFWTSNLLLSLLAALPSAAPPRILTLGEALDTARTQQPQLRQAAAATQAALARADAARAALLPQVGGSVQVQRATANSVSRPGSGSVATATEKWDMYNSYDVGLDAGVLIYDFGQTSNKWRSSLESANSLRESERASMEQVLFSVRTAFFQARAARGFVQVASDTLTNQQKHMDQTQAFVEAGQQAEIALAQAKTDLANAKVQLINAQNSYETAKARLNQAMGAEGPANYDVADESLESVNGEDETMDTLLDEAIRNRPELSSLAAQVRAQELTVRAAKGAYGPSLGFSTGFTDAGDHVSDLTWNWNAALVLSIPVFKGGLTQAQVREAEATLISVRSQLDLARQQVRFEVEQALLAIRAAKAAVSASGEALVNAGERLRLAEGRYETGFGSIIELGDAQVALTSAQQQEVQSEYNLAQARAGLLKALGRN